jgi:hypothetical protein
MVRCRLPRSFARTTQFDRPLSNVTTSFGGREPSLGPSGGYVFNLKATGLTTGTYRVVVCVIALIAAYLSAMPVSSPQSFSTWTDDFSGDPVGSTPAPWEARGTPLVTPRTATVGGQGSAQHPIVCSFPGSAAAIRISG